MSGQKDTLMIMDPVHGTIQLQGKEICRIIDTEEFQRLRKIKQLGGACYVYPGANHTRFEHSIGLVHAAILLTKLSSELMRHLRDDKKANDILKKYQDKGIDYEKCVKVAALCHDIGHGPYSHLYDFAVKDVYGDTQKTDLDKLKKHEYRSVAIFDKITEKLKSKDRSFSITDEEKREIGIMITFSERCKDHRKGYFDQKAKKEKSDKDIEEGYYQKIERELRIKRDCFFLYEIVANGFTEVDVDKMDYFIRDGHGLGLPSFFDWRRYVQTLKVCDVGGGALRLCSREKEAHNLYQLFHIRNRLYRQAYRHKTTVAVEHMLKEALISANEDLLIGKYPILEAWRDTDAFLQLNDSIEDIIFHHMTLSVVRDPPQAKRPQFSLKNLEGTNNSRKIGKASDILEKFYRRELLKFVFSTGKGEVDNAEKTAKEGADAPGNVIMIPATFHYGMKSNNPVQENFFYSKGGDTPFHLSKEQVSEMLPEKFFEKKLMYYYQPKDSEDYETVRAKLEEELKKIYTQA